MEPLISDKEIKDAAYSCASGVALSIATIEKIATVMRLIRDTYEVHRRQPSSVAVWQPITEDWSSYQDELWFQTSIDVKEGGEVLHIGGEIDHQTIILPLDVRLCRRCFAVEEEMQSE
jgi:hypothetical protein